MVLFLVPRVLLKMARLVGRWFDGCVRCADGFCLLNLLIAQIIGAGMRSAFKSALFCVMGYRLLPALQV